MDHTPNRDDGLLVGGGGGELRLHDGMAYRWALDSSGASGPRWRSALYLDAEQVVALVALVNRNAPAAEPPEGKPGCGKSWCGSKFTPAQQPQPEVIVQAARVYCSTECYQRAAPSVQQGSGPVPEDEATVEGQLLCAQRDLIREGMERDEALRELARLTSLLESSSRAAEDAEAALAAMTAERDRWKTERDQLLKLHEIPGVQGPCGLCGGNGQCLCNGYMP